MKSMFAGVVAIAALALVLGSTGAGDKDKKTEKPKYKISEVMKKAMAGEDDALYAKVAAGTASAAEKKHLIELFASLHQSIPPKGERTKWEKVTKSLYEAAVAAEKDAEAAKKLPKLIQCANCHKEFKLPKKS